MGKDADPTSAATQRATTMKEMEKLLEDPPPYTVEPANGTSSNTNGDAEQRPPPVFDNLDFAPSPLELPTAGHCMAHLKLLHAFAALRKEVGNHEGIFGIDSVAETVGSSSLQTKEKEEQGGTDQTQSSSTPLAERIREKRWTVFVTKAVDRFEQWWSKLPDPNSTSEAPLRMSGFDSENRNSPSSPYSIYSATGYGLDKDEIPLPPLDVLMVWHAYMLNPRAYFEDCIRLSKRFLWTTIFPWETIYKSIDNETYAFTRPQAEMEKFAQLTRMPWDYQEDMDPKIVTCPKCKTSCEIPWTTPPVLNSSTVEDYLSSDRGFAGKAFEYSCPKCHLKITHEALRVGKFINDAITLQLQARPLPGTILNSNGLPQLTGTTKRVSSHDPFFPCRVLLTEGMFWYAQMRKNAENLTIDSLRRSFDDVMREPYRVTRINKDQYNSKMIAKESKIAVRKFFSHYWDNSCPFAIDLVGAVIRQGGFVQKMVKINWIRSPAAVATMQRLIVKYHRFMRIIGENKILGKMAVPTLDIDLAWHTHQLTPRDYLSYSIAECGQYVNHDDKISESTLNTNFKWTSTQYEKKYGQPYSECACWYCECTREPLRSSFSNRFSLLRSKPDSLDQITNSNLPKDPTIGPHISAHNAMMVDRPGHFLSERIAWAQQRRRELEELDLQYAKVCKRYQKKKKADQIPKRDSTDAYMYYGAYGYPMPMPMPVVVPYYAEETDEGDRYTCADLGEGGCAAGTCAGSASLGSCAGGFGTPSCQASCGGHGSAAGGCGTCSSGGDGGGGGGGGDGGGCGGGGD